MKGSTKHTLNTAIIAERCYCYMYFVFHCAVFYFMKHMFAGHDAYFILLIWLFFSELFFFLSFSIDHPAFILHSE